MPMDSTWHWNGCRGHIAVPGHTCTDASPVCLDAMGEKLSPLYKVRRSFFHMSSWTIIIQTILWIKVISGIHCEFPKSLFEDMLRKSVMKRRCTQTKQIQCIFFLGEQQSFSRNYFLPFYLSCLEFMWEQESTAPENHLLRHFPGCVCLLLSLPLSFAQDLSVCTLLHRNSLFISI